MKKYYREKTHYSSLFDSYCIPKLFIARRYTLALATLALLTGCASPNMRLSEPGNVVNEATNGKALVTFIRPDKYGYSANAVVYDGDTFVGVVPYQQKYAYLADPGEHMFMVVSEAADFMKADLIAGKKYFVKVVPRLGGWRPRFSLEPIHKSDLRNPEVQQWIAEGRFVKNNDTAYEFAKRSEPSAQKKKKVYFEKWQNKPESEQPFLAPEDGQ